jgi:Putative DNA-binding domain
MNSQNDSTALAQQQRDLLHAVFTIKNIATKPINMLTNGLIDTNNSYSLRSIQTYQANVAASAQRSLKIAYPVIAQLIGDNAFAHLARDLWAKHPPTRGDLAQWGGDLSGFIANIQTLQTEPYLCDVARAEWALHTAATAADQTTDVTTFSLLAEQDPAALTLQLAPGAMLIHSSYPIASMLAVHLYDSPSFEEVGYKLRQNIAETALVWRQGLQPRVSLCAANEAAFISQLLKRKSLLQALETATSLCLSDPAAPFDISIWLPIAMQKGLLLGAKML